MQAVVVRACGAPDVLEVATLAVPSPGPGEVTIDVHFAGVGFIDTLLRSGAVRILPLPMIPGVEAGGTVREVGSGVVGFAPGDAVVAFLSDFSGGRGGGGYAQVARASSALTIKLNSGVDMKAAVAALVNGTTALMALEAAGGVAGGDAVLIPGASGGVAGFAVQIAKKLGARRIIGVASTARKRALAQEYGCSEVLPGDDLDAAINEITGGKGVDLALDAVGGTMRESACRALAPCGRMIILGNASGLDAMLSGDDIWQRSLAIQGFSLGNCIKTRPETAAAAAARVMALVEAGELVPHASVLPLNQAAEAHRRIEAREASGKLLLAVR